MAVLHKAGIVLLTAAWETYVESVVIEGATFLSNNVLTGPPPVQYAFLQDLVKQNVLRNIGKFNTPNWMNVRDLFKQVLGITDITEVWNRPSKDFLWARAALNEWLAERHGIAHGGEDKTFLKADVQRFQEFLKITVERTDEATRKHLEALVSVNPW